ncbi:MAG: LamG-like jellyroll fold domain-containing protein [Bacteroidota bacterium]
MVLANKKYLLLFLFFPLFLSAQDDSRLVAHYSFQNSADDQSGNDNHGSVFNVDLAAGYTGEEETAYQFKHDKKSYIRIPHSNSLSLDKEMTLMAWMYYEKQASGNFFTILEKTNPDFEGHSRYGMWVYNGGVLEVCVEPDNCPNGLCQRCLDSRNRLIENRWYHVAGTYDGTHLRTYLNGKLNSEFDYGGSTGISQTNFELFLGTDLYSLSDDYLSGRLDEVRIYNVALTEEEIYEIGNVTVPTKKISNTKCTAYPNLTQQNGELYFSADCEVEQIRLVGIDGRLIFEQRLGVNLTTINLAQHRISSGIYFLQLIDRQGHFSTQKVVIEGL